MSNLQHRHRVAWKSLNLPHPLLKSRGNARGRYSASLCLRGILLILLFLPFSASADTYKWTDDQGVMHFTDDPTQVPDKYWEQEKVKQEEVKPSPSDSRPVKPGQPSQPTQPAPTEKKKELFGDYPLEWWIYKFQGLKNNIADYVEKIAREKNFIDVFEGGKKFGKIFTAEEIARYDGYKADIPVLEEKLKQLKEELDELERKAIIAGVPREIREK